MLNSFNYGPRQFAHSFDFSGLKLVFQHFDVLNFVAVVTDLFNPSTSTVDGWNQPRVKWSTKAAATSHKEEAAISTHRPFVK